MHETNVPVSGLTAITSLVIDWLSNALDGGRAIKILSLNKNGGALCSNINM